MNDNDNRSNGHFDNRDHSAPEPKRKIPALNIVLLTIVCALLIFGGMRYFGDFFGFFGGVSHGNMPADGFSASFSAVRSIDVSMSNSAITVTTHSGNDIRVDFVPPTRGNYTRPNLDWNSNTGVLRVYEQGGMRFIGIGSFGGGRLAISIPADSAHIINEAQFSTTNGSLDIGGMSVSGTLEARATNGRVSLSDLTGREIIARTTNGRVDGSRLDATRDLTLRTTNGAVSFVRGSVGGHLTVRSTNGAVTVTNVDFDRGNSDIRTTNGRTVID